MTSPRPDLSLPPPPPERLLLTPLDYIHASHLRERVLCRLCDRLAETAGLDRGLATVVVGYLETELVAHFADDQHDLFPLLARRAKSEDEIGPVLETLKSRHVESSRRAGRIAAALRRLLEASEPEVPAGLRSALATLARNARRDLAVENAIVLPLARLRLSAGDKAELGARMASRRGVQPPA